MQDVPEGHEILPNSKIFSAEETASYFQMKLNETHIALRDWAQIAQYNESPHMSAHRLERFAEDLRNYGEQVEFWHRAAAQHNNLPKPAEDSDEALAELRQKLCGNG